MTLIKRLQHIKTTICGYFQKDEVAEDMISSRPRLPLFDDNDEVVDWQGRTA